MNSACAVGSHLGIVRRSIGKASVRVTNIKSIKGALKNILRIREYVEDD